MKTVVICGSRKYKPQIRDFAAVLKRNGALVYQPFLTNFEWAELAEKDPQIPEILATGLTLHHLEYIRKADIVFIYNQDGYVGNSVTLEIGAAAALHKPIYALEEDDELCRRVLYEGTVKTPKELLKILK